MEPLLHLNVSASPARRLNMAKKLIAVALLGSTLAISACSTVRGAAADVTSVANCTEEMIKRGECKR
jgi:predicted small secreted protein